MISRSARGDTTRYKFRMKTNLGSYYCVIIFPNTVVRLLLNSKGPDFFNVTQQDTARFFHAHQKRVEVLFNVTQQDTASFLHAHQKRVKV